MVAYIFTTISVIAACMSCYFMVVTLRHTRKPAKLVAVEADTPGDAIARALETDNLSPLYDELKETLMSDEITGVQPGGVSFIGNPLVTQGRIRKVVTKRARLLERTSLLGRQRD